MALTDIVVIPCLSDNYAYLLRDESGATAVIDAPEEGPIIAALDERGWSLDWIWLTHHHADHIDGVAPLVAKYGAKVLGGRKDSDRLPALDKAVEEGETIALGAAKAVVIDVSGHTINHIAFNFSDDKAVFTGDSLFVLGCGRVFEGTHAMMWESLAKLARLDPATRVYCGHEYTEANLRFARTIETDNAALAEQGAEIERKRAAGQPTVPTTIGAELAANPFLRGPEPALQNALDMHGADPGAVFGEVRRRKDSF